MIVIIFVASLLYLYPNYIQFMRRLIPWLREERLSVSDFWPQRRLIIRFVCGACWADGKILLYPGLRCSHKMCLRYILSIHVLTWIIKKLYSYILALNSYNYISHEPEEELWRDQMTLISWRDKMSVTWFVQHGLLSQPRNTVGQIELFVKWTYSYRTLWQCLLRFL